MDFTIKSFGEKGQFQGYASTFENLDHANDRIQKGAFCQSLKKWEKKQCLPHLFWEHSPWDFIGTCSLVKEDDYGLKIHGQLFLNLPQAQKAYAWMQEEKLGLSVGFYIVSSFTNQGIRHIRQADLEEISLCLTPCNPKARIQSFKSLEYPPEEMSSLLKKISLLEKILK